MNRDASGPDPSETAGGAHVSTPAGTSPARAPSAVRSRTFAGGVLALGLGVYVYLMFPGAFFSDTLGLYAQARTHQFEDWHSPVLAVLWGGLDRLVPGFAPMLAFGAVTLGVGLFLTLRAACMSPLGAAALTLAVLFAPPFFTSFFWLSKDPAALGTLMLALGVSLGGDPWRPVRPARAVVGALLLAVPCLMRADYAPLAGLAVMGLLLTRTRLLAHRTTWVRAAAVLLIGALFFAANLGLDSFLKRRVFKARRTYVLLATLHHDLAALSLQEGRVIATDFVRAQGWDLDYVRTHYTPRAHDPLTWPPGRPPIEYASNRENQREAVRLWAHAVLAHPGAYLRHRAGLFRHLMALTPEPRNLVPSADWLVEQSSATCATEPLLKSLPPATCVFRAPPLLRAVLAGDQALEAALPVAFHPLTFVAFCLAGLALAAWRLRAGERSRRVLAQLLLAGLPLAHLGVLFFLAQASEWRYLCLLILGGLCSAAFLLSAAVDGMRRAPP